MASVGLNVDGYKNVPNYKNLFVAQGKNYLFSPENSENTFIFTFLSF